MTRVGGGAHKRLARRVTAKPEAQVSEYVEIIYDLGANKGDNIPYYLKKAGRVVAVEANPLLADQIRSKFEEPIKDGRLNVENFVLTCEKDNLTVDFYIHKTIDVRSQFPRPDNDHIHEFTEIRLPAKNVLDLFAEYGKPYYIKIDLENYDQMILQELFSNDVRPDFISAESHSIEVFSMLLSLGGYRSFNIVDGPTVESKYKNCIIQTTGGVERYSFKEHTAGPFGEDIEGDWMTPDNFFRLLAFEQLGWKDIHATNAIPSNPYRRVHSASYLHKELFRQVADVTRAQSPLLYRALRKARRRFLN
jgi:FkbM family methyltransferase